MPPSPTTPTAPPPAAAPEAEPTGLSSWMSNLGPLDGQEPAAPPPAKKPEETVTPPVATPAKPSAPAVPAATATKPTEPPAQPAAEKPAEKPTTPPAEGTDKETWPRNAEDWQRFRENRAKEREDYKAQIAQRDTQLTTLQSRVKELETSAEAAKQASTEPPPELKAELEQLRKDREELSKRLAVAEVTSHPDFQAHFQSRTDEQIAAAQEIVGAERAETIKTILNSADGPYKQLQLEEVINELTPYQQIRMGGVINEMGRIARDKQKAIAQAESERSALHQQRAEAQKRQMEGFRSTWKGVVKAAQAAQEGNPMFQLREGKEEWNAAVRDSLATAEAVLFGRQGAQVKPEEMMTHALNAAAYPRLLTAYKADMAEKEGEIAKLQAQVKELLAAQPKPGGTTATGGSDNPTPAPIKVGMSPQEAMGSWMQGVRSAE